MTPNLMKSHTDTSKHIGTKPPTADADPTNNNFRNYNPASDDKSSSGEPLLSSRGAIGKQFTAEGAVGGTADTIGGPFKESGAIGSAFTESGAIGGTVNKAVGGEKK